MSGGIVPIGLLCAALGLMLGFVQRRAMLVSLAVFAAAVAATAGLLDDAANVLPNPVIGSAMSAALAALSIHLPREASSAVAIPLSLNGGVWCGAIAAQATSSQALLLLALPLAVALPCRWLVARHWAIVPKIASGWLIAIAVLAAALPMITTPGYEPDHME